MSIRSNMKTYKLYQINLIESDLGEIIEDLVYIDDIEASINYTTITGVDNGLAYNITQPQGLTEFKLDKTKKYRLEGPEDYDTESINPGGRYTQLILKEVII